MKFHVLASGSKGNATFIYKDGCGILIDCGITRKQLLFKLQSLGYKEEDIQYVFLTHDHYDHSKNIHIFDKDKIYSAKGNIDDLDDDHILVPYNQNNLDLHSHLVLDFYNIFLNKHHKVLYIYSLILFSIFLLMFQIHPYKFPLDQ